MNEFKDRVSSTLNHKILDVKSVERDESGEIISMEVEVIRNDGEGLTQEGTQLNADNLNNIVKGMIKDVISTLPLTDETIVNIDKKYLKIPTIVIENFDLPLLGDYGSTIEWLSSDTNIIKINNSVAEVTRDLKTKTCTLTAKIRKDTFEGTKSFIITVPYREMTDLEIAEYDSNNTQINEHIISSYTLPTSGERGSTIEWLVNCPYDVTFTNGNIIEFTRPTSNASITLSGTFKYGSASVNKIFDIVIIGTDCYTPKSLSTTMTQVDGELQINNLKISTSNLEGLYIEIENNAESYLTIQKENNGTNEVTLVIGETDNSNSLNGSGTYKFNYKVFVYLSNDHDLLLGTIDGEVTYHATSSIPED